MTLRNRIVALALVSLIGTSWASFGAGFQGAVSVTFANIADEAGISFRHENGSTLEKYLPETMGGGGLIFDYDDDGWPDMLLINGGSFADENLAREAQHKLYRNNTDGTFTDRSDGAGLGISGFGMGACSADYDNDGWVDLYITSVETNKLYRNTGEGNFIDVTAESGTGSEGWSASCAFGDVDRDGDVDLYVTNYVDFRFDNNKYCGDEVTNERVYCHPNVYNGLSDVLYSNNGDGTFTDVSMEAGVYTTEGKGLGVVFGDYDNDGWIDIYVANDSVRNFLFQNLGDGTFEEVGLLTGVALGEEGKPLAGMGTDMGDIDNDGLLEVIVTNLSRQTHNLYKNFGNGLYIDATYPSGVGAATLPFVGFGTAFLDYDNDMDLDLAIANGDVIDNIELFRDDTTYPQRNLLLANDGTGRFRDVGLGSGPGFGLEKVSRALAVGDLDNDGDLDLLIVNSGQTVDLLQNDGGNQNNSILVRLVGEESNRDGIGARLQLEVDGKTLSRDVRAGSSYLAQSDLRVHFGLGQSEFANRLEVTWPSGTIDILEVESLGANQVVTVSEGRGATALEPFRTR
jgi:hypothetical protein